MAKAVEQWDALRFKKMLATLKEVNTTIKKFEEQDKLKDCRYWQALIMQRTTAVCNEMSKRRRALNDAKAAEHQAQLDKEVDAAAKRQSTIIAARLQKAQWQEKHAAEMERARKAANEAAFQAELDALPEIDIPDLDIITSPVTPTMPSTPQAAAPPSTTPSSQRRQTRAPPPPPPARGAKRKRDQPAVPAQEPGEVRTSARQRGLPAV